MKPGKCPLSMAAWPSVEIVAIPWNHGIRPRSEWVVACVGDKETATVRENNSSLNLTEKEGGYCSG